MAKITRNYFSFRSQRVERKKFGGYFMIMLVGGEECMGEVMEL
jgi:hypothetical protein